MCIEPDPFLFSKLRKKRKQDICLNIGIGANEGESDFYILNEPLLNTFSKEEAEKVSAQFGYNIKKVVKITMKNINQVIETNFSSCPTFISILFQFSTQIRP